MNESADYDFIIALVYNRSRIRLHDGKHALIRARLGKRIRFHGFDSFHDYCQFLRHDSSQDELTHVIDALTTNFTAFLREPDHFDFLVNHALKNVAPNSRNGFNLWSAACATGEEPYSIAFHLAERYPDTAGWNWNIHASDVSTSALSRAKSAIYPADRLQTLPSDWLQRYFQRGHGHYQGQFRVKSRIRQRVHFDHINLLGNYSFQNPFDTIFCRNVMIYFDRLTQHELVRKLSHCLVPGGFLITGHSESLNGLSSSLRCLRPSIYQKI